MKLLLILFKDFNYQKNSVFHPENYNESSNEDITILEQALVFSSSTISSKIIILVVNYR